MPVTEVVPFIIKHPELTIPAGTGIPPVPATDVVIRCQGHSLAVEPDQDENTFETFCGTYTTYSPEKWSITISCYTSYGTNGLWTLLRPLVGKVVGFKLLPDGDAAVSVDNPQMAGTAMVKAFPFLSGDVSDASDVDVVLAVQGAPTFATTGTTGTEAQSASSGASSPASSGASAG